MSIFESMDTLEKVDQKYVDLARSLAEKGVKYVMASWIDILGRPNAKSNPISRLPEILSGFARYTPRGICGIGEMNPVEEEVTARPDPSTLKILPWDRRFAWMAADMWSDKGEYFELCPRSILKRQIAIAEKEGFTCTLGVEPEFYVFRPESLEPGTGRLIPISHSAERKPSPAYDVEAKLDIADFMDRMVSYMDELGFKVFAFGVEGGEGQYEIDFYYSDILDMADRLTLFRLMAREVAKEMGLRVTFMPKPFENVWGSGAHFNMGLYSIATKESVFRDKEKRWTKEAYAFAAGIMKHARALAAISNPLVNSYKRLVPRLVDGSPSWAPIRIAHGPNNRTCMLRFPENRPVIENRSVDAAANVYLAGAFMLAAGLKGIREGLDAGPPADFSTYEKADIPRLPRTLLEAIEAFKDDPLTYEVFTEGFVKDYVDTKLAEWEEDHARVSDWERKKYLLHY